MKKIPLIIILIIIIPFIVLVAVPIGWYYWQLNYPPNGGEDDLSKKIPEEGIFLKIDKATFGRDEAIKASVESRNPLFTGFPGFEVHQLVDDKWQYIDVYDMACALPCTVPESEICTKLPIACAPLPEHCQDFDPKTEKFEWGQTILKTRQVECPKINETRFCSYKEKAESGTYKVVFQYSENCANEDLFEAEENNIQKIEKEFEIK